MRHQGFCVVAFRIGMLAKFLRQCLSDVGDGLGTFPKVHEAARPVAGTHGHRFEYRCKSVNRIAQLLAGNGVCAPSIGNSPEGIAKQIPANSVGSTETHSAKSWQARPTTNK